jgi:GTPase SAR1 family protein
LFRECHAGDAVSILVGNKVDKKEQREVEREEGAEKAK